MTQELRISVAIPIHNEASVLPELLSRTLGVLEKISGGPHQILFVDDGSTDETLSILTETARHEPRVTAVSLREISATKRLLLPQSTLLQGMPSC